MNRLMTEGSNHLTYGTVPALDGFPNLDRPLGFVFLVCWLMSLRSV